MIQIGQPCHKAISQPEDRTCLEGQSAASAAGGGVWACTRHLGAPRFPFGNLATLSSTKVSVWNLAQNQQPSSHPLPIAAAPKCLNATVFFYVWILDDLRETTTRTASRTVIADSDSNCHRRGGGFAQTYDAAQRHARHCSNPAATYQAEWVDRPSAWCGLCRCLVRTTSERRKVEVYLSGCETPSPERLPAD